MYFVGWTVSVLCRMDRLVGVLCWVDRLVGVFCWLDSQCILLDGQSVLCRMENAGQCTLSDE